MSAPSLELEVVVAGWWPLAEKLCLNELAETWHTSEKNHPTPKTVMSLPTEACQPITP